MAHPMRQVWVVGDDAGPHMDIYPFPSRDLAVKSAELAAKSGHVATVWRVLMCDRFVPTVTVEHEQVGECECEH